MHSLHGAWFRCTLGLVQLTHYASREGIKIGILVGPSGFVARTPAALYDR
jgi:hypothetical protein